MKLIFYSPKEIAELLKVPEHAIEALVRKGEIGALSIPVNGKIEYRINEEQLQKFLKQPSRPKPGKSKKYKWKLYDYGYHDQRLKKMGWKQPRKLLQELRDQLLSQTEVEEKCRKLYVIYIKNKKTLRVDFRKDFLITTLEINGQKETEDIHTETNFNRILSLFEQ